MSGAARGHICHKFCVYDVTWGLVNHDLGFHPVNNWMEICLTSPGPVPPTPCALQQHPRYGQALRAIGAYVHLLTATDGNQAVGQAQVLERRFGPVRLIWLPRGPVWHHGVSQDQKWQMLAGLPKAFGKRALWLGAPDDADEAGLYLAQSYRALITPQYMAELDLTPTQETRLAAQQGKWRNRLRRAEKSHLRIRHRPYDLSRDAYLLALETSQRRARRYRSLPVAFTHAWARQTPKATRLFMAHAGGDLLAYLLILLHRPVATYHIGWTSDQGRRLNAHNLLMWQASNWLAGNGYERFDLGHVDTENTPGLARFKIGTGANIRALGPTFLRLPVPAVKWPRRPVTA
jgi:lipid II:glycine glycyltransferase (peptidoglycan interpeptide bridge formation enzyme)